MFRKTSFWITANVKMARARRSFVVQPSQSDCGPACIISVLLQNGVDAEWGFVRDSLNSEQKGTDLKSMKDFLHSCFGLSSEAFTVGADNVSRFNSHSVILRMKNLHFVLLIHSSSHGFLVYDPNIGVIFYNSKTFQAQFSGHLLAVEQRSTNLGIWKTVVQTSPEQLALSFFGATNRLILVLLLLYLCFLLSLIQSKADSLSYLFVLCLMGSLGLSYLFFSELIAKSVSAETNKNQSGLFRNLLKALQKRKDLLGFKGRTEWDAAGKMLEIFSISEPQRNRFFVELGNFLITASLLCFLSIWLAFFYLLILVSLLIFGSLETILVQKMTSGNNSSTYVRFVHLPGQVSPIDGARLVAECFKWGCIFYAGILTIHGEITDFELLFWILFSLQIVTFDFSNIFKLDSVFKDNALLSSTLFSETQVSPKTKFQKELRDQVNVSKIEGGWVFLGIRGLMASLEEPQLTGKEQRQICINVIEELIRDIRFSNQKKIRLFNINSRLEITGSDLTFDPKFMLKNDQETRSELSERMTKNLEINNLISSSLSFCDDDDFPIFFDPNQKIDFSDLSNFIAKNDISTVGVLTMNTLSILRM